MKETAIIAGGCFWCIEAVFSRVIGVENVVSGYIGGVYKNPTYQEVCTGNTLHAEAVRIEFNSETISFETILDIFFSIHDPTQLNRQGQDIGTQYRSEIFYLNEEQKSIATQKIDELTIHYSLPIVTKITAATMFYPAENYHQNYFAKNPQNKFCQLVIPPKFLKMKMKFFNLWKKE